jgi:metallo-beta-lactamase family protein
VSRCNEINDLRSAQKLRRRLLYPLSYGRKPLGFNLLGPFALPVPILAGASYWGLGPATLENTPLYSTLDALHCIGLFGRSVAYGQPIAILPNIFATFFDAGHILGSASILLDVQDGGRRRSVLFSGDIGNAGRPLLRAPQTPPAAEIVVMETTYGDRLHRPFDASVDELYEAINSTLHRGGNILIPTFALERTQDILFFLHKGIEQSRLPPSLPVFLDSPMAISATEIFKRHPEAYRESAASLFDSGDPFDMPGLRFARERAESMAIAPDQGRRGDYGRLGNVYRRAYPLPSAH